MKICKCFSIIFILMGSSVSLGAVTSKTESISLYLGYVTQVHCQGKLYLSSVGNAKLITREAFPSELGCGVLLQPLEVGTTDLLLKTSTGDIHLILEVRKPKAGPLAQDLEIFVTSHF